MAQAKMILDRPPKGWRRPQIPDWVKLQVLINQSLRCAATDEIFVNARVIEFDHRPALWERKFDTALNDTIPPANAPMFIEACLLDAHKVRTHGTKATSYGSDSHERAKDRRLTAAYEAFKSQAFERPCGQKRKLTGNWPKGRKLQSRNNLRKKG